MAVVAFMALFVFTCPSLLSAQKMPTCADESRPTRITYSYRTGAEGPVKYFHVREGVGLMEQLRWYELAREKEGQPLTGTTKEELLKDLSLELLSSLGKTEPLSGTTLPARCVTRACAQCSTHFFTVPVLTLLPAAAAQYSLHAGAHPIKDREQHVS